MPAEFAHIKKLSDICSLKLGADAERPIECALTKDLYTGLGQFSYSRPCGCVYLSKLKTEDKCAACTEETDAVTQINWEECSGKQALREKLINRVKKRRTDKKSKDNLLEKLDDEPVEILVAQKRQKIGESSEVF